MAEAPDFDLLFAEELGLGDAAAAALEDYARVLSRAEGAEVLKEETGLPTRVRGLRLRAAPLPVADGVAADVFAFARGLAEGKGGGLGWS